jgi:glutaredoxin
MSDKNEEEYDHTLLIITKKSCPGCEEAKQALKELIDKGEAVLLDIDDSDMAKKLNEVFNFEKVPSLVLASRKKGETKITFCILEDLEKKESGKCVEF